MEKRLPKFEPLAGMKYIIEAKYDDPLEKTGDYGPYWMYSIAYKPEEAGGEMTDAIWFVRDRQHQILQDGRFNFKTAKGRLTVGQAKTEKGTLYNTYEFELFNGGQQAKPKDRPQSSDSNAELEKRKRLTQWCIDTIEEIAPKGYTTADRVNLIQSLHVWVRNEGIYPTSIKDEIDEGIRQEAEQMDKDFANTAPTPGDEDLPF